MAAAATDKLRKLSRRWVGQIGAGGVSDAVVTTIPLSSATNLATDTGVDVVIDRVDANGTATPTLEETITGVVSGSNIVNAVRGVEGTAQAHNAGAVVEVLVTAAGYNSTVDHLLVEHNQSGTHKGALVTTLKATGAEINTGTEDAKIVTPKAIADSKVSITDKVETLTNKTLTSPKLNEDVALTSTSTELNALDGQTAGWTTYTVTPTNITLGSGTLVGKYWKVGRNVNVYISFVYSSSTVSGLMGFSLPVTAANADYQSCVVTILDSGTAFIPAVAYFGSTSRIDVYALNAAGTYLAYADTSATVPMTWANNDTVTIRISYESAT